MSLVQPDILFVAGMHRSGTSAVAGYLLKCGGSAPSRLLPSAPDNPRGFNESPEVVKLNDNILEHFGSNWRDPSSLPDDWVEQLGQSDLRRRLLDLLRVEVKGGAPLILKDPRLCRTLPVWEKTCRDLGFVTGVVVVYRDPLSVARSLWQRNHIPSGHSLQLWCRYYLDIETTLGSKQAVRCRFESLLNGSSPCDGDYEGLGLGRLSATERSNAMDPSLVHYDMPAPESRAERALRSYYETTGTDSGLSFGARPLRLYYSLLGGDAAAIERRHYGTVAMILDKVIEERSSECHN